MLSSMRAQEGLKHVLSPLLPLIHWSLILQAAVAMVTTLIQPAIDSLLYLLLFTSASCSELQRLPRLCEHQAMCV